MGSVTTSRLGVLLGFSWSLTTTGVLVLGHIENTSVLSVPHPRPADPVVMAADILRSSDRFASAAVGPAAATSTEVLAWRVIIESRAADSVFKSLLAGATRSGQLYALAGIFLTDHAGYVRAAAEQRTLGGHVQTLFGCIGTDQPVRAILVEMDRGEWSGEFLAARARPFGHFITIEQPHR